MSTIVTLELEQDDESANDLLMFLREGVAFKCPDLACRVDVTTPGSIQPHFGAMMSEVLERAEKVLERESAVRCAYIAPRQLIFPQNDVDSYTLEVIVVTVVEQRSVSGFYVVPNLIDTPPRVQDKFLSMVRRFKARRLNNFAPTPEQRQQADLIANTVMNAFVCAHEYISGERH